MWAAGRSGLRRSRLRSQFAARRLSGRVPNISDGTSIRSSALLVVDAATARPYAGRPEGTAVSLAGSSFTETNIEAAVRGTTNQDIAATIIGYIRHIMLNEALIPYERRVDTAIIRLEQSHPWTREQKRWLMRIGKQLKENVIIDRTTFDDPANVFAEHAASRCSTKSSKATSKTSLVD